MSATSCKRQSEDLLGVLEGTASESLVVHLAGCDTCRDARHELESATRRWSEAGDDFVLSSECADRLAAIVDEAHGRAGSDPGETAEHGERAGASSARIRESESRGREGASPSVPASDSAIGDGVSSARRRRRRAAWLVLAACASVAASVAVGFRLADHHRASPEVVASRAWHGKVARVSRSGADPSGGFVRVTASGKQILDEGAVIEPGTRLSTDGRTRARIEFDDGTFVVMDRATELEVDTAPRTLVLAEGAVIADVAHLAPEAEATDAGRRGDGPAARIRTPEGEVMIVGTKLAVTAAAGRTNVEVLRGEVLVGPAGTAGRRVSAGQEGVVTKDGRVDVAPVDDLAQRAAFGEQLVATHDEDAEVPANGLGELRARKPGKTDERDHAVRLQRHAVKVRIAGNVARTEIDETFANETNDELEGIYRFPLPHGAQIEKLALEVDGKLVDGEFVDKAKAAAIWRGAIHNAVPQAPKPREEIVWVPGPWHDPALLEWARGGRFELKIFPIPKHGSRRVVIAYTENVAPVSGVRRYVYPLPAGASSRLTIDDFEVDAQVVGHDAKAGVRVRGYELQHREATERADGKEGAVERLGATMRAFTPSGDLAIEYALEDASKDLSAWAYASPAVDPSSSDAKSKAAKDPVGNDPFVALALRPKLPRWADAGPRDQVIVVDAGRAMYGERFARAKRLAVQLAQEMDRRDRLTVLACDVTCKALPAGFASPGATGAHDVDAFLASVIPDGASDLVSAVRRAQAVDGHERGRALRVVLVSDGVATAGYRAGARVATEVAASMTEPGTEVVAVPLGSDADVPLLTEIARGSGGVVVPYQPGQRLEATALEVLNATYGTTLRDVELVLPEGLRDVRPSSLPPLRAGAETIVTARMVNASVKGDVVLRGKVGGDPFEARYPLDVRASTEQGNAFVPRLFAASRIADGERESSDASRTELVALSRRFSVPSKFTSLLVLESEAMFKAFGIDRTDHAAQWTGEAMARGQTASTSTPLSEGTGKGRSGDFDAFAADEAVEAKKESEPSGLGVSGMGLGGGGSGPRGIGSPAKAEKAAPAPAPTVAAPAAPPASRAAADAASGWNDAFADDMPRRRGGRFMKKVFVRRATIAADAGATPVVDKIALARAAVQAAPDERARHKELAKWLAVGARLDELGEVLEKWSERDPLDADVIVGRADLAARRGNREEGLRILGGALAASAMSRDEAFVLATTLARGYERLSRPEACSFRVTAAELKPSDNDAVARAIACEREGGRGAAADRWLLTVKDAQRASLSSASAKVDVFKAEPMAGDIVASASWDGGSDLDVAIVDPGGRRAGVVTRMKGARIEGAVARDHETVALATGDAGAFFVEIVRANSEGSTPVSGKVTIRAFGQTQTIPFTLVGARQTVGRVDVRWDTELVPVDGDLGWSGVPSRPFDRGAAAAALGSVEVRSCSALGGPVGTGHVTVAFGPSGRVEDVTVDDGLFRDTPSGRCVQSAFFRARVPAFDGATVHIGKSFTLSVPIAR